MSAISESSANVDRPLIDRLLTDRLSIDRLLIVRLSAMGDVIHTLPAAQSLRAAFPNAMIGWLIEERWAELLCAPGTPLRGPRSAQRPLVDWVHHRQSDRLEEVAIHGSDRAADRESME